MGGTVTIGEGEWLEYVWTERPVRVSRDGLTVLLIGFAPTLYQLDPWALIGGRLRFNRYKR